MKEIKVKNYIVKGDTIIGLATKPFKKTIGPSTWGSLTSFDDKFSDEEIVVGSGAVLTYGKIGNINEVYEIIKRKIPNIENMSINEICSIVFETVYEYFGGFENVNQRMKHYKDMDFIESEDDYGKISDLKGKNSAMCVERAALSQNLLIDLGIKSIYKSSNIMVNGKLETHAYNLIDYNDEYYIYDATIPTFDDDTKTITPLVAKISKEAFESISMPLFDGCSVLVSHYNPLQKKDVTIVYDCDQEKKLIVDESNSKFIR